MFFIHLKLNMSETRKSKNWKFYVNTVKNVSTASHSSEHATFLKVNNFIFGQSMFP